MTFADPAFLPVVVPVGPMTRPLREQIEAAVAAMMPAGKVGAALGVDTAGGMEIVAVHSVDGRWRLAGEASRKWGGKVSGQVMAVGAW